MKANLLMSYKCVTVTPIWQGPLTLEESCIYQICIQNATPEIKLSPLNFRCLNIKTPYQKTQNFELTGLPFFLTGLEFLTLKISLKILKKNDQNVFFQEQKILNPNFRNIPKIILNENSYFLVLKTDAELTDFKSELLYFNHIPSRSLKSADSLKNHKKKFNCKI